MSSDDYDLTLAYRCCVFSRQFPLRRTPQGRSVSTYDDLVLYLQAKHPSIRRAQLAFDGKNQVLYVNEYSEEIDPRFQCIECEDAAHEESP